MQVVETTHITIGKWSQMDKDNIELSYTGSQQRQYNHSVIVIHWFSGDKRETWMVHQYRASQDEFHINFRRKICEIYETIARA